MCTKNRQFATTSRNLKLKAIKVYIVILLYQKAVVFAILFCSLFSLTKFKYFLFAKFNRILVNAILSHAFD